VCVDCECHSLPFFSRSVCMKKIPETPPLASSSLRSLHTGSCTGFGSGSGSGSGFGFGSGSGHCYITYKVSAVILVLKREGSEHKPESSTRSSTMNHLNS
jgi:hypothetical protein